MPSTKGDSTARGTRSRPSDRLGRAPRRSSRRTIRSPAPPCDPLKNARAAVREQIGRGADWIKLFPAGNYSFTRRPGAVSGDLSDAGAAGAGRGDAPAWQEERVPRVRRRGTAKRDCRRLRQIEHAFDLERQRPTSSSQETVLRPDVHPLLEPYMDDNDAKAQAANSG